MGVIKLPEKPAGYRTGLGFADCAIAFMASCGDEDLAVALLRFQGQGMRQERAGDE